jgi:histidyl-tRNA synthetase
VTPRAPKGTDDILPPESERWRIVLRTFDDLAERYGYGLVMTPMFEATELFARGVGEDTEVVEKQMYTFADRGGRSLTLRPEATASVVRAYLDSGTRGVLKVAYSGPMFRYERPQAGRRRQFHQLGVEYLGEPSADADVEVIALGYRLLREVGIDDAVVLLGSIGDADDRSAYREVLRAYLVERADQLTPEALRRIDANPLRVLDSKADAAVVADAPTPLDHLGEEAATHLAQVRAGLERLGIPYEMAPRLVRGLDYYNRTVFEYESPSYDAAQASLGGGGRYDPLAELLGGAAVPAVGLALGVDRIVLAMPEVVDLPALDVFVVVAEPERRPEATDLVYDLRAAGLRADLDLGERSVKAQFRAADRRRAMVAVVVGAEWDDGKLQVRHLASGEESTIRIEEAAEWLSRR